MWWSRPLPWAIGVRPNSPPQIDQRVVEHPALLQVLDQGRGALVDLPAVPATCSLIAAVVVPVAVVELDEPDPALGQPAGQQAIGRERAVAALGAVEVEHVPRLAREVHQLGDAGLHPEGGLVAADPGGDLGVGRLLLLELVEPLDGVDHVALALDGRRPGDCPGRGPGRPWSGTGRPGTGWAGSRCATAASTIGWAWPNRPVEVRTTKPGQVLALAAQPVSRATSPSPAGRRWSSRCS